jgi:hypothetical protein
LLARFLAWLHPRSLAGLLAGLLTLRQTFPLALLLAGLPARLRAMHIPLHLFTQALGLGEGLFERLAILVAGSLLAVASRFLDFLYLVA